MNTTQKKPNLVSYTISDSENSEDESVTRIVKDLCQQCMVIEHKYKCPRCSFLTCSLTCVKVHKGETGCSGVKEKIVVGKTKLLVSEMTLPGLR